MRKYKNAIIYTPDFRGGHGRMTFVDGPRPYINLHDRDGNGSTINDRDVKKLRNWCNKILRLIPKRKAAR